MVNPKDNRISVGKTTLAILAGEDDLSGWSDEELERGQKRDPHGRWVGRKPKVVARPLYDELVRRKLSAASDLLRANTHAAVQVLVDIAKDPRAENRDRLKAVEMILNRTLGKEPVKVAVEVKAKWEEALAAAIIDSAETIDVPSWEEPDDDGEGRYRDP
jgi:hypothetical protein